MDDYNRDIQKAKTIMGVTVFFLVGIGIIQIIIGQMSDNSIALVANGIDCIGGGFVTGVVWVGLKYFQKPANLKFQYGYYRIEHLASIAAAVIMVFLAIYIGYRSYEHFLHPEASDVPLYGIVIALIAAIGSFVLGYLALLISKRTKMRSIRLEALHTIKDGGASLLVVIALVFSIFGFPIADAVAGFIISFVILSISFTTLKESGYFLADACDNDCIDMSRFLSDLASGINGVEKARMLGLRRSGPKTFGDMEIEVSGDMSVKELEKIKRLIHKDVKKKFKDIEQLTITSKPYE